MQVKHLIGSISDCCCKKMYLEIVYYLMLEYLLYGILIKRCALEAFNVSNGVMLSGIISPVHF